MSQVEGVGQPAPSAIQVAEVWAAAGFRCFPVNLHTKRPIHDHWDKIATSDVGELRNLFSHSAFPGQEWACALIPGSHGYVVFDCDVKNGKRGVDLATDLGIPSDFIVTTPSGGEHRYVRKVEDMKVSNASPWSREGIDIRSDTGYVLAPGTPGYVADGFLHHAVECPATVWKELRAAPAGGSHPHPEVIGDRTKKMVDHLVRTFPECRIHSTDGGVVYLTRPGKRHGISASVGYLGDGVLWNYSSTWDVRQGEGHYSEVALVLRQGRLMTQDKARANDAQEMADNAVPDRSTWHQTERNTEALLSHLAAPEATILRRADGPALLYPAKLNVIFGKSEGGKTWLTIEAVRQVVEGGGTAAFADFEDSAHTFAARLRDIGWDPDPYIRAGTLLYWTPSDELRPVDLEGVDLLVIDSASHFLGLWGAIEGGSSNSNDHVARVYSRMTRLAEGTDTCIVLIDHGSKGDDKATIGASSKRNVINGAEVRVVNQKRFAKGTDGWSAIYVTKDRNGGIKGIDYDMKHDPAGGRPWGALTFTLDMDEATMTFISKMEVVEPRPEERAKRITKAMEHETAIISVLVKAPGHRMRSSNLRAHASLGTHAYQDAIIRMVDKGIVTTEDDPSDGRVTWVVLTDPNDLDLLPPDWEA